MAKEMNMDADTVKMMEKLYDYFSCFESKSLFETFRLIII